MPSSGTRVTGWPHTRHYWPPASSLAGHWLRKNLFMHEGKRKVLLVASQPIQNAAPLRLMSLHPDYELLIAYCSLSDSKLWRHDEQLNKGMFDTLELNGYKWIRLANWSPLPQLGKFYGLINPG